jgi:hypothetical protein
VHSPDLLREGGRRQRLLKEARSVASVDRQVHEELLDLARIHLDLPEGVSKAKLDLDVLADQAHEHLVRPLPDRVEVDERWREELFASDPVMRDGSLPAVQQG